MQSSRKENRILRIALIGVVVLLGIAIWHIITQDKYLQMREYQMHDLKAEVQESKKKVDSLRVSNQNLEKVAKTADAKLALSLKQLKKTPTIIQYKQSLDLCLEARTIDYRRIKTLKGLDAENQVQVSGFEKIVELNDEFAKRCRGKQRKSFAIGFVSGLVVGLIIP